MKKFLFTFTPLVLALGTIFFLKGYALQFGLVGLFLSLFWVAIACVSKNTIVQYVSIIIFTVGFVLSGAEAYYYYLSLPKSAAASASTTAAAPTFNVVNEISGEFYDQESYLGRGYAPLPNKSVNVKRHRVFSTGEKILVYDVTYSTDEHARRITPQHPNAKTAVLLLGCSHTFGEGLSDKDIYAYQLAEALGDDYQVMNFGFSGYGTHQVYHKLKAGIPGLDKYERVLAYYMALDDHKQRITGVYDWSLSGPRYILKDGKLVHVGSLETLFPYKYKFLHKILQKSLVYKAYSHRLDNWINPYRTEEEKNELFTALTLAVSEEVAKIHPKNFFSILGWDWTVYKSLQTLPKSIPITDVLSWFPNNDTKPELYTIKHDGHPNKLAHTIIAQELEKMVRRDVEKLK